ncbi:unnamed protein product, partial [marine sediment metagenome]
MTGEQTMKKTIHSARTLTILSAVVLAVSGMAIAAVPPALVNYQGVLRDNLDNPLDGDHDMVFRFFDADGGATCVGGNLLLTDSHLVSPGTGAVTVTGGLFNADLGGGNITPGTESTLAETFPRQWRDLP